MTDLLRRAWDTLDTFKQAYPENWHDDDERVLKDLMQADLKLSGVKLKWVGLTDEEKRIAYVMYEVMGAVGYTHAIEAKLKEKNTYD